ncbi:MAG TPA: tetratricopeptide repeat protein, partial [Thermodesulfobacteriota bacterium]|nr:tetratricopeptide repeat protein [Thermodesulfobacteriota bacterium]
MERAEERKGGGPGDTPRLTVAAAALLCALASFLVYAPTLNYGFINWDDPEYVYNNPLIRSMDAGFFISILTRPYFGNWHPLTMLSYALDYRFWGLNPAGYHLTNIVFHGLNTALVLVLAVRLLRASGARWTASEEVLAGVVAAVFFGLHPVHAESVAWVSERKDVLSAFFFILSLLAYLKYAADPLKRRYAAALVFFILALMSKPMAVTLPVVLLVLDFYPLRRSFSGRTVVEKLPFFALAAGASALTMWAQKGALAREGVLTLGARVATAVRAAGFYLYKMALPFDLAPYYPHPVSIDFFTPEYIGAAVFLAAVTVFCFVTVKRHRGLLSGWLYYLVTLLPVLGLIQVGGQAAADRYTYIPSIGVAVLLGAGVAALAGRLPARGFAALGTALSLILAASLSYGTLRQAAIWKDSETLWTYEIGEFPKTHVAYNNRGLARQDRGEMQGALEDFSKAISLAPELAELYNNRGAAFHIVG